MLAALAPGAIWAHMSTIGVAGIDGVAALAGSERPDVMLLDAPVSGSKDPAERGELTIFASGPGEARARVAPLFDALGQRTIWVGEAGAGTRLKLVNNTWLAFATEAVAASVALARRLGLDAETVADALGGSPVVSAWQAAKLQRIAHGEFSAQFALSLALKDVRLALQAGGGDRFATLACLAGEWQQAVDQAQHHALPARRRAPGRARRSRAALPGHRVCPPPAAERHRPDRALHVEPAGLEINVVQLGPVDEAAGGRTGGVGERHGRRSRPGASRSRRGSM